MKLFLQRLLASVLIFPVFLGALIADSCVAFYYGFFGGFDKITARERVVINYEWWTGMVRRFYLDLWTGDPDSPDFMEERA